MLLSIHMAKDRHSNANMDKTYVQRISVTLACGECKGERQRSKVWEGEKRIGHGAG